MKYVTILMGFAAFLLIAESGRALAIDAWEAVRKGDYQAAERVWRPRAEKGEIEAQVFLGHMESMRGRDGKAAEWYALAAAKGDAAAQALLANLYLEGRGVPRDPVIAYAWYDLAAANGHRNAAKARDQVAKLMSQDDVRKAVDLAQSWIEKGPPNQPTP